MVLKELKKYNKFFQEYTELRVQENRNARISLVNGDIAGNSKTAISGVSARVYKDGSWGFASHPEINDGSIQKVIKTATDNAVFLNKKEDLGKTELPVRKASSENDFTSKEKKLTQKELIDFLKTIDDHILAEFPDLTSRTIIYAALDMEKALLTSDDSFSYSMIPRSFIYVIMNTKVDGTPYEMFEAYGGFGEFEDIFKSSDQLNEQLKRQYKQLMEKANGVYARAGVHEVIMDADLAGILAHEAIGHTTEADIVKGGSVAADYLNTQVASPLITLVDFAHHAFDELCPVPVFVDDEGTAAKDAVIIENGILKRYMNNKETALHFNHDLSGNARAYGFYDEPLVRMRNTAILPGESTLEEMIASIKDGYYLIKPSNGQADSTSEFMFGVTMGYEIKNGKLGKAIKDTTISGVAFDLLKTVTMVSNDMKWDCSGMCGKKQSIPVGMGGPAIKCKVNIGGK